MEAEKIKLSSWSRFLRFIIRSILIFSLTIMAGILFFLFLYFGDLFVNSIMNTHKKPLFGIYIIASDSMVPALDFQDAIVIHRTNSSYKVGDIVTFSLDSYYDGKLITHRIVEKEKKNKNFVYTTKGDHNSSVDPISVSEEDIYGKVILSVPKLGYIQDFVSSFFLYFLLIFLILFGFLLHRVFLGKGKEEKQL